MTILYYIHDPMCSWCWGFKHVWEKLQKNIPPDIEIQYLLGGLAKDSCTPMPEALQQRIKQTWHTIQHEIPGTKFNFDFWINCKPRRSTYPACRAVIAARKQKTDLEIPFLEAIQQAYYLEARNPSDFDVLTGIAKSLGLDCSKFREDINSTEIKQELAREISRSRQLGAQGFPSLVLQHNNQNYFIHLDYKQSETMLSEMNDIIAG